MHASYWKSHRFLAQDGTADHVQRGTRRFGAMEAVVCGKPAARPFADECGGLDS